MKAKLYSFESALELVCGKVRISSIEGESKKDFTVRAKTELENLLTEEVTIVEIPLKTLESLNDEQVIEAYKVSSGVQEKMLLSILGTRKIEVEKIEKKSRAKVEKRDLEEMKASPEYKDAKSHVGDLASFTPAKGDKELSGIVKSISLNKTNTVIYFNILVGTDLKCCTSKNATLKFTEF